MPILPAEPNLHPADLLDRQRPGEGNWWVLHTKPRQEKRLAAEVLKRRAPFYLPLVPSRNLIRGKVVEAHLPLFPGYLFLFGTPDDRVAALATRRVVRALPVTDEVGLRRDLAQVHHLIASGLPVRPEDRLVPGALVEIRTGPLEGLRGIILHAKTGRRFVVQVNFIQCAASVELPDYHLAAIPVAGVAG
jgi:transcriptional antiterminator RfaH